MHISRYILFVCCIAFFNCSSEKTENTTAQKDTLAEVVQQKDSAVPVEHYLGNMSEPDSLKISKLEFYTATWDATYFPLPSVKHLLTFSDEDPFYTYLIENFDTLSTQVITENYEIRGEEEESVAAQPCAWRQDFKSNISYSSTICSESGETSVVHTSCPDKKVLVRLVDILFHTNDNIWNADSTEYKPIEEDAGCYYSIDKNDTGTYDIKYYCGY